jgi:hypothetical protein
MDVMCRVGTVGYTTSGECEGVRGIRMKGRRRQGGESEDRRRVLKKRSEKNRGEKEKWGRRGLSRLILDREEERN